jgi:hypothetical protein
MNRTPRESRIAERAYALWEAEGRPEGRDKEHWSRAEAEDDPGPGEVAPGAAELPERYAPGEGEEADAGLSDALAQEGEGAPGPAAREEAEPAAQVQRSRRPNRGAV